MYSYLFNTPTGIEAVNEKTAHTYIKHPSGAQKAGLTYMGAVLESEYRQMMQDAIAAKKEKFGTIGQGEENDNLIRESREFTDSMVKNGINALLEKADKTIKPANFDFLYGNINNLENAGNAGSLAEARQKLITRR